MLTITSKIKQATQVNLKPVTIVDSLCLAQKKDFNNNEPTYKTKDISNVKLELWQKNISVLNPIQALMQKLNKSLWYKSALIIVCI